MNFQAFTFALWLCDVFTLKRLTKGRMGALCSILTTFVSLILFHSQKFLKII